MQRHSLLIALIACLVIASSPDASAQQEVIASNVPAYRAGERLSSDPVMIVPAGRSVKLRDRTRRMIYTINGPYSGPLSAWVTAFQRQQARPQAAPPASPRRYRQENYGGGGNAPQGNTRESPSSGARGPSDGDEGDQGARGGGVSGNIETFDDRF